MMVIEFISLIYPYLIGITFGSLIASAALSCKLIARCSSAVLIANITNYFAPVEWWPFEMFVCFLAMVFVLWRPARKMQELLAGHFLCSLLAYFTFGISFQGGNALALKWAIGVAAGTGQMTIVAFWLFKRIYDGKYTVGSRLRNSRFGSYLVRRSDESYVR